MRTDGFILFAAAALAVIFIALGQATAPSNYVIAFAVFVCALVLIGIKHALASMRRPLLALVCCLLGRSFGAVLVPTASDD
jgi:hypothetical protein